jgi:UDP-N-acetylmuramyl pentapeptide phosphotransferase/UDP-N-acetylglucosamine-1-phosphate transferase
VKTTPLLSFFLSFLITVLLAFFLKKLALKKRILIPQGIPLIGGIAIGISFLFAAFFVFSFHKILNQEIIGLVLASFFILIFGVMDDIK